MFISKFLKDNKIARARRATAICSVWNNYFIEKYHLENKSMYEGRSRLRVQGHKKP